MRASLERNNAEANESSSSQISYWVSTQEGEAQAEAIGAVAYRECSSLTRKGLDEVFEEIVRIGLEKDEGKRQHIKKHGLYCKLKRKMSGKNLRDSMTRSEAS